MTIFRQTFITMTALATLAFGADAALAQSDAPLPELPKPIENLVNEVNKMAMINICTSTIICKIRCPVILFSDFFKSVADMLISHIFAI